MLCTHIIFFNANLIIISHFFFISEARKGQEGKLFVIYDNES